jgi:hypothetical protein
LISHWASIPLCLDDSSKLTEAPEELAAVLLVYVRLFSISGMVINEYLEKARKQTFLVFFIYILTISFTLGQIASDSSIPAIRPRVIRAVPPPAIPLMALTCFCEDTLYI